MADKVGGQATATDFAATASALGYSYQFRQSLLLLLVAGEGASVRVESLDDIEVDAKAKTLHQLKLHKKGNGDLSDASVDLWKTIRVWSTLIAAGKIGVPGTSLVILTTSKAPAGSAASLLKTSKDRNPAEAYKKLVAAKAASKNKKLASAFTAFDALSETQRLVLVDAITVLDGSPDAVDVGDKIAKQLALVVAPAHRPALLERLEGWWLAEVIKQLSSNQPHAIGYGTVQLKVLDIAEQFRSDSLPIDFAAAHPGTVDATQDARLFVTQLREIQIGSKRIENAILDYYRAYEQRSRWVREDLILDDELADYEARLVDEWERISLAIADELPSDSQTEAILINCGKRIFKWMELEADIAIRPRVTAPYVMRGSYHLLADRTPPKVWWHPKFIEKLKNICSKSSGVANATVP